MFYNKYMESDNANEKKTINIKYIFFIYSNDIFFPLKSSFIDPFS